MAKALLVAYVNPADETQEQEFNRWYDEVHLPQVVERIPGVVGGSRYRLAEQQLVDVDALPAHRYLTLYELDTDDLATTAERLSQATTDGTLDMSGALNNEATAPLLRFYEPAPDVPR